MGRSWFPPEKIHTLKINLVTDASKFAWGAHISPVSSNIFVRDTAQGQRPAQGQIELCRGVFTPEQSDTGSTYREL